jgi:hypothetical protein
MRKVNVAAFAITPKNAVLRSGVPFIRGHRGHSFFKIILTPWRNVSRVRGYCSTGGVEGGMAAHDEASAHDEAGRYEAGES